MLDLMSTVMSNEEKLLHKKRFYRSLKDGTNGDNDEKLDDRINDEDYLTRKKIWKEFSMKNMGDYHDHYLKKDVLLLPDVFENFIDTCLKFCSLGQSLFQFSWIMLGRNVKNDWWEVRKNCGH